LYRKENSWVFIDKTTDASGRKVANVVIGILKNDQILSAVNHTVPHVFNESMQTLWPDRMKFDTMLLLVTDAATNMKKAAEELSVSYPYQIHVMYVAQGP
jgi:hypothetical protein